MSRRALLWAGGVLLFTGCAGPGSQARLSEPEPALAELRRTTSRLELRLDEVTLQLLALRERVDAQEAALAVRDRGREEEEPQAPLRVVRLEPPPPGVDEGPREALRASVPEADLYRRAFHAYREGRYGQAILDFEEFLLHNPDHEYADNAQYWIGESYYSQGEYGQAVVEFNRVLEAYPQRAKAPDALFKIGLAYEKLGEPERGAVFLRRLVSEYPRSEAALQARRLLNVQP
jgi:tol-pal system protein YbgF